MAKEVKIGGKGALFSGEDKVIRIEILDDVGNPIDTSSWVVKFVVRYGPSPNADLVFEVTSSLEGTFNPAIGVNTQRRFVLLTDTQLTIPAGVYYHSWKRLNDGSETVLAYGEFEVEETTQG